MHLRSETFSREEKRLSMVDVDVNCWGRIFFWQKSTSQNRPMTLTNTFNDLYFHWRGECSWAQPTQITKLPSYEYDDWPTSPTRSHLYPFPFPQLSSFSAFRDCVALNFMALPRGNSSSLVLFFICSSWNWVEFDRAKCICRVNDRREVRGRGKGGEGNANTDRASSSLTNQWRLPMTFPWFLFNCSSFLRVLQTPQLFTVKLCVIVRLAWAFSSSNCPFCKQRRACPINARALIGQPSHKYTPLATNIFQRVDTIFSIDL